MKMYIAIESGTQDRGHCACQDFISGCFIDTVSQRPGDFPCDAQGQRWLQSPRHGRPSMSVQSRHPLLHNAADGHRKQHVITRVDRNQNNRKSGIETEATRSCDSAGL